MRRETLFKFAIVGVTVGLCGALAWSGGLFSTQPPPRVRPAPPEPPRRTADDPTRPLELGLPLDAPAPFDFIYANWPTQETTLRLLPWLVDHQRKEWHPVAINRPKARDTIVLPWPEHPQRRLVMLTNELGLRDDQPTTPTFDGTRILVLGDSHTYGLVENRRSFSHLLERRLGMADDSQAWNVLNAGVSGTGPLEHVGRLIDYLVLEPDLVLLVLFNGNDFNDAILWTEYFTGGSHKLLLEHANRLRDAVVRHGTRMSQGFSQAYRFKHRPGDEGKSLIATVGCVLEMRRLCDLAGIPLVVAMLPTKVDIEPFDDPQVTETLFAELGLTDEDYAVSLRLGRAVAMTLREEGLTVVDLGPSMTDRAPEHGPFFWRQDQHLNMAGHAHVAARLENVLLEALADR